MNENELNKKIGDLQDEIGHWKDRYNKYVIYIDIIIFKSRLIVRTKPGVAGTDQIIREPT